MPKIGSLPPLIMNIDPSAFAKSKGLEKLESDVVDVSVVK